MVDMVGTEDIVATEDTAVMRVVPLIRRSTTCTITTTMVTVEIMGRGRMKEVT